MRSLILTETPTPSLTGDRTTSIARGVVFCPVAGRMSAGVAGDWAASVELIYRIAFARAAAEVAAERSLYNAPLCLN